jgi:hypothetical protein
VDEDVSKNRSEATLAFTCLSYLIMQVKILIYSEFSFFS